MKRKLLAVVLSAGLALTAVPATGAYAAQDVQDMQGTDEAEGASENEGPAADDVESTAPADGEDSPGEETDGGAGPPAGEGAVMEDTAPAESVPEEAVVQEENTAGQAEDIPVSAEEETPDPFAGDIPIGNDIIEEGRYFAGEPDEEGGLIPIYGFEAVSSEEADDVSAGLVGSAGLPSSYQSPRSHISTQTSSNLCWAFSTMSAAENDLIRKGYGETNFAELHMVYGLFHGDKDTYARGGGNNGWTDAMGNYLFSTAALAANRGAADEAVYPNGNLSLEGWQRVDDTAHVGSILFLTDWPSTAAAWKGPKWEAVTDEVKAAVYAYGSVSVTFRATASLYDGATNTYTAKMNTSSKPTATHAATIIGWDDEKTTPDGKGAFLIMNSYGTEWGEGGLGWLSYANASLANPVVYVMEDRSPGDLEDHDVFTHTETGWTANGSYKSQRAIYGTNVFTAERGEQITKAGFYTNEACSYTVEVRKGGSEPWDPSVGELVSTASGSTDCAGFYKVALDTPVMAAAGEKFAVSVKISTANGYKVLFEGGDKTLATGYTRTTSCGSGESYYYNGSSFVDCAESSALADTKRNICIYAYGDPYEAPTPEPTETPSKYASEIESGKTYILVPKKDESLAVDVYNGNMVNYTRLWLYSQNGTEAQKFTLIKNSDGTYQFVNQKCELSIDVYNNSSSNGATVQIYEPNYTAAQKWRFEKNGDGTFTILNNRTGKAFDIPNGTAKKCAYLQMYTANGTDAQRFYLLETETTDHSYDGTYYIRAAANLNLAMDVYGAGTASGTNIWLYTANNSAAQQFKFIYSGDGYYRITNVRSKKVVDVYMNSPNWGTNIWQYDWNGSAAQRWKVVPRTDGAVYLKNANGMVIDICNGTMKSGTNIWQYYSNDTKAQAWKLVPAS